MADNERNTPPEEEPLPDETTAADSGETERPPAPAPGETEREKLERKLRGGRTGLLIICCASLLNMLLLTASNITMSFSLTLPQMAIAWARTLTERTGSALPGGAVLVLAALFVLALFVLWRFSRTRSGPVLAFLVLYAADTALLLLYTARDIPFYMLDYLFHAWALFAIVDLLRTKKKIQRTQTVYKT